MRFHPCFPPGDGTHVNVHAHSAPGGSLAGGTCQAGPPKVLDADHQTLVEEVQTSFNEPFLLERIADLHTGALLRVVVGEPGRGQHAHAADPVPTGGGPQKHGQVANPGGPAKHQALDGQHPEAKHVDQGIPPVGGVEFDLAAHRGHADRVAIPRDTRDHSLGDPSTTRVVKGPKPEGIHEGDGAGTHGEDVPEDPAHPGGRTLVGLDGRRMVVGLDANGHGDPFTDVDDPSVLPGADQHPGRLGGESA